MNLKGLAELRRRLNPTYRNPSVLLGRYVSPDGQTLSSFAKEIVTLTEEDNEKYMSLFKKVLSGAIGQNLLDIEFTAAQVLDSDEYRLLSLLLETGLRNIDVVDALFDRLAAAIPTLRSPAAEQSVREQQEAKNYLLLAMFDGYDVPYKDENGEKDMERSTDLFKYMLCCVCPVKQTKATLNYDSFNEFFHSGDPVWAVGAPELGFLYPSFEERSADLYHTQYYTRDSKDIHEAFIQALFNTSTIVPPEEQKENFRSVLEEALGDECSLDVVQAVHETVVEKLEERKAEKNTEPLLLTKQDVTEVLADCGVSTEKTALFEEKYDEAFGATAELPAVNLVTPKKFNVSMPNVTINVDPGFSDLIETRVIDGRRYILVPADGDVEVNGIRVKG